MKKWTSLVALFAFICVPILFFSEQDSLMGTMTADAKGGCGIYLHWASEASSFGLLPANRWEQAKRQAASLEEELTLVEEVDLTGLQLHYPYGNAAKWLQSPYYFLYDQTGIILQTSDPQVIRDYLDSCENRCETTTPPL